MFYIVVYEFGLTLLKMKPKNDSHGIEVVERSLVHLFLKSHLLRFRNKSEHYAILSFS